jgi:hypothetical protein
VSDQGEVRFVPLTLGAVGPRVERWQRIIGATVSGEFDEGTARLTRIWQGANELPMTGVVDRRCWAEGTK